jgi:hypothetical protein
MVKFALGSAAHDFSSQSGNGWMKNGGGSHP